MRWLHYSLLSALVITACALCSCQSVKPYQRVYLNDPEMQMGSSMTEKFEDYVMTIREGATVAGSAKSSGGCGCN